MRKIALSFALAGILGATAAVAETDGAFAGIQLSYGGITAKNEVSASFDDPDGLMSGLNGSKSAGAFRYGLVAGYKQFFTENFGLRYYGVLDFGTDYKYDLDMQDIDENGDEITSTQSMKISSFNINANVDALFNFVQNETLDFGAFAGLSLGYVNHNAKNAKIVMTDAGFESGGDLKASGFDLGINLGLKAQIAQNHGVELFSRFGVLQSKKETKFSNDLGSVTITNKFQQPYQVGVRYTFSF